MRAIFIDNCIPAAAYSLNSFTVRRASPALEVHELPGGPGVRKTARASEASGAFRASTGFRGRELAGSFALVVVVFLVGSSLGSSLGRGGSLGSGVRVAVAVTIAESISGLGSSSLLGSRKRDVGECGCKSESQFVGAEGGAKTQHDIRQLDTKNSRWIVLIVEQPHELRTLA